MRVLANGKFVARDGGGTWPTPMYGQDGEGGDDLSGGRAVKERIKVFAVFLLHVVVFYWIARACGMPGPS